MKTIKIAVFVAATVLMTAFTTLKEWHSDPAHSAVAFTITHLGISDVMGTFNDFTATIHSEKADFSDAIVEATINVASVNTRVEARDKHLKSVDFFEADKYPTITFKSTAIKKVGNNKYKLTGNLKMKGITKPVTLDLTYRGTAENPSAKKTMAGFKLSGMVKRTDFGIGSSFPTALLSDEVALSINTEVAQ